MEEFYRNGLHFSCDGCSKCCRFKGGVVLLSQKDLQRLSDWAGLNTEQFIKVYCRWLENAEGEKVLCLRDLHSSPSEETDDCIFWDKTIPGCTAYEARPEQCRTYPFWTSVLKDRESWDNEVKDCPGINKGPLHSAEEIKEQLALYQSRIPVKR